MPATLLGRLHMKVTTLPILKPCSPSGNAQPTITSSISSLFKFEGEINLLITCANISSGLNDLSSPLYEIVKGDLE